MTGDSSTAQSSRPPSAGGRTSNWAGFRGKPELTVSPIGYTNSADCPSSEPNNGADFGPDSTGTTTCGIQEAINTAALGAAPVVRLLGGTFNATGIQLPLGVSLRGVRQDLVPYGSVIQQNASADVITALTPSGTQAFYGDISDLFINGDGVSTGGIGLRGTFISSAIRRVTVSNFNATGLAIESSASTGAGSSNFVLEDVLVRVCGNQNNGKPGVTVNGVSGNNVIDGKVFGLDIESCQNYGLSVGQYTNGLDFHNLIIDDNAVTGANNSIKLDGSRVSFLGGTIHTTANYGVDFTTNGQGCRVIGMFINGPGTSGGRAVHNGGGNGLTVMGCEIDAWKYGIDVSIANSVFQGNRFGLQYGVTNPVNGTPAANTFVTNNPGYNPVAKASLSPVSTTSYTWPYPVSVVTTTAGTVSALTVGGQAIPVPTTSSVPFHVGANVAVVWTWSVQPVVEIIGE
jgi:hypothetical protein